MCDDGTRRNANMSSVSGELAELDELNLIDEEIEYTCT